MCGIAGILSNNHTCHDQSTLQKVTSTLSHRGPDSSGIWSDSEAGISLCHTRLSIIDLSPAGHQPMQSESGQYVLTYNGEIYNHLEIRKQLEQQNLAPSWKGHSDTETLLAGFQAWGIEKTILQTTGMFAFALWDKKNRTLTLGRDRIGEKPLYYGWQGNTFLFSSELKAIRKHPAFKAKVNRNGLALFLRHSYIPTPYSIYEGIHKLTPGTTLTISLENQDTTPIQYWSMHGTAQKHDSFTGSETEAVEALDSVLRQAIQNQMASDVPLGAFLSGGIDSSTITAIMQSQSEKPVQTFTIGFEDKNYNEADQAKAVAKHLGTSHTETYVTPRDALNLIPDLPKIYDEPFADASQIPTFLVSKTTRQHVTVALSGDAGDELFGGYNRYFWTNNIWRKIGFVPVIIRQMGAQGISALSPAAWNNIFTHVSKFLPKNLQVAQPGDKAHKLAQVLAANSPENIYWGLVSHWKQPTDVALNAIEPPTVLTNNSYPVHLDFEHRMMYQDTLSYLPDDILTKVDRAAMAVSLETRVPFLDHKVIDFAWSLPLNLKIRNGQGKWILRQVLNKYVPTSLIDRPKMGFGIPIDSWLRGPLKDWAENLLSPQRLRNEGYLNPAPIQEKWQQHQSGKFNWQYYLWNILMFQSWLEQENQNG
ncbi:MAG: asparagine synthase (glutamine-hydrolyzing) [Methyloligellaceae bacterium]